MASVEKTRLDDELTAMKYDFYKSLSLHGIIVSATVLVLLNLALLITFAFDESQIVNLQPFDVGMLIFLEILLLSFLIYNVVNFIKCVLYTRKSKK